MKKFLDMVNKKELVVSEDMYHVDNFIDKLEDDGIYVVTNQNDFIDYSGILEDITEAFLDIVDDLEEGNSYFKLPTQEKLMQIWNESGYKDMNEKFDKELAKEFYYSDCVVEALDDDAHKFLDWLDSKSRFFTYVTANRIYDTGFYDLIEYHPLTNLESDLLIDEDNLEKEFFDEWYTIEDEEGNQKEFSLDNSNMLDRYMFEKYNAIEVTE